MKEIQSIFFSTVIFLAAFLFLIFASMSISETGGRIGNFSTDIEFSNVIYLSIALNIIIFIMSLILVPYVISSIITILLLKFPKHEISTPQKGMAFLVEIAALAIILTYGLSHFFQFTYLSNSNCMCFYSNAALIHAQLEPVQNMDDWELFFHQYHIESLRSGAYEEGPLYVLNLFLDLFLYAIYSLLYFSAISIGYIVNLIDPHFYADHQISHMEPNDLFDIQKIFSLYSVMDFFFDDMAFDNFRTLSQSESLPRIDKIVLFWQMVRATILGAFLSSWRIERINNKKKY